jgi:hypothetical protein
MQSVSGILDDAEGRRKVLRDSATGQLAFNTFSQTVKIIRYPEE